MKKIGIASQKCNSTRFCCVLIQPHSEATIHRQEYREEYRHRTGTVVEVTKIGVCYQLGGTNWLSGSSESCGVYLSICPVTLDGTRGALLKARDLFQAAPAA